MPLSSLVNKEEKASKHSHSIKNTHEERTDAPTTNQNGSDLYSQVASLPRYIAESTKKAEKRGHSHLQNKILKDCCEEVIDSPTIRVNSQQQENKP